MEKKKLTLDEMIAKAEEEKRKQPKKPKNNGGATDVPPTIELYR